MVFQFAIVIVLSYLIGNISFARILSRFVKQDITSKGSGNPGTMNMLRTFGFKMGILTLVLDALKGVAGALIGLLLMRSVGSTQYMGDIGLYVGGLAAVLGHIYPVFYRFKGGKGVATTLGLFLVANPLWTSISFVFCFFYLLFFEYGSVSSFILLTTLTVVEGLKFSGNVAISLILFSIFFITWFAHRENIVRLLIGKETKVNFKKILQKLQRKNLGKEEAKQVVKDQKKLEKEKSVG